MTRGVSIGDVGIPQRLKDLWKWVIAIDAWVYCDPEPLAKLILDEDIPPELKPTIVKIISGDKKQNKKGAQKLKIPAKKRMEIAYTVSGMLHFVDDFRYAKVGEAGYEGMSLSQYVGDRKGLEPIELANDLNSCYKEIFDITTNHFNVSRATVENLLRDLRTYIKNWPDI